MSLINSKKLNSKNLDTQRGIILNINKSICWKNSYHSQQLHHFCKKFHQAGIDIQFKYRVHLCNKLVLKDSNLVAQKKQNNYQLTTF